MTNKLSHPQAIAPEKRMCLVVSNGLYRLLAHGFVRVHPLDGSPQGRSKIVSHSSEGLETAFQSG